MGSCSIAPGTDRPNVRYCNLYGLNLLDLPGLKWFCLPKNRTLTGGGIYYQRRPLEAISVALAKRNI